MIEVTNTGSINTTKALLSALETPLQDSADLSARIFLIECTESLSNQRGPWTWCGQDIWQSLLRAHLDGNEYICKELESKNDNILFLSWHRLVAQSKAQYEIGKRIVTKPYDIDTIADPLKLKLEHKRYYQTPKTPNRKYGIISSHKDDKILYHAFEQCISCCWQIIDGVFTCMLLVDPVRYHLIVNINFKGPDYAFERVDQRVSCFLNTTRNTDNYPIPSDPIDYPLDQPYVDRLAEIFKESKDRDVARNPQKLIEATLARGLHDDITCLLRRIGCTLDTIELSLHDDMVLQNSVSTWRSQLGWCRHVLFRQGELIRRVSVGLGPTTYENATTENSSSTSSEHAQGYGENESLNFCSLGSLAAEINRVSERVEIDHQALMSSMSIVESARAIAETQVVSKLTHLAFFFIPLSLISSVFGMNINTSAPAN
ncbi:hypothetical protein TWF694_008075 [Orbilia ellipsospora]|uniref:Uncharacterized protein n=1 Tax=Orbilia ellipsospora TaxID=2528407 RepID=A0AAV9XIC6_9PEZI